MKHKKLYSYHRSYVVNLQIAEYENEEISPEDIDLNELRFATHRKWFIGGNLIQFIDLDIDKVLNDEINVFNKEMAELKRYADVDPDFFWSYAYQLFDKSDEIDETKVQEFKRIQDECKKALLKLCNESEKGIIHTPSTDLEKELCDLIVYEEDREWYEFPDLESAVEFEVMALRLSPSCIFRCKECGRLAVGSEKAQYCSREAKFNVRELLFEEKFENGFPSIFHPYFKAKTYTCKDAKKDVKLKERRNSGDEFEKIYHQSMERIKQRKRRKKLDYHPEYENLKKLLKKSKLLKELKTDYQQTLDEEGKKDILEDYKKLFDILLMPADENGDYMTWEKWGEEYNNY